MRRDPQVLLNIKVADKAKLGTSAAISEAVHSAETKLGEKGRVLVRASGTEPFVRVMVEAEDEETASDVAESLAAVVRDEIG